MIALIAAAGHGRVLGVTIIAVAAVIAVAALVGRGRLSTQRVKTAGVTAGLFAAFGLWTALLGDGRSAVGIVMFALAVATFRLMNHFERPTG